MPITSFFFLFHIFLFTPSFPSLLLLTPTGLPEKLSEMNSKLEEIQKSLDMYLETKRQIFPRFYFLSNDDLLEILGQSRNPEAVQPHLKKCFDNIKSLRIGRVHMHTHTYTHVDIYESIQCIYSNSRLINLTDVVLFSDVMKVS